MKISTLLSVCLVAFLFNVGTILAQSQDVIPPEILSFDFNPKLADITNENVHVLFSIIAVDDLSGNNSGFIQLLHESGTRVFSGLGSELKGVITFNQSSLPGIYTIEYIRATDAVGNSSSLTTEELKQRGFPVELEVVLRVRDGTPPTITSFDFNPKLVDITNENVHVLFSIMANDDLSGNASGFIQLLHETGTRIFSGLGPDLRGVITFNKELSLDGYYVVEIIQVTDMAGNSSSLNTNELNLRGFPNKLIVSRGNTPTGRNIRVEPIEGVTIIFEEVTKAGQTDVVKVANGSSPPAGFKTGDPATYYGYGISTTAEFSGEVNICVNYNETEFKDENGLGLFHFIDSWSNVKNFLDSDANVLCGDVTSLSEFSLFEKVTIDHLIDEVNDFDFEEDLETSLLNKLNAAKSALENGKTKTAINILKAFINFVEAQRGKSISGSQADILLADANTLIGFLFDTSITSFFKLGLLERLNKWSTIVD